MPEWVQALSSNCMRVRSSSTVQTYAQVRAGNALLSPTADLIGVYNSFNAPGFEVRQGLLSFDLSGVTPDSLAQVGRLYLRPGSAPTQNDAGQVLEFRVYSYGTAESADFVPGDNLAGLPLFGSIALDDLTFDVVAAVEVTEEGLEHISAAVGGSLQLVAVLEATTLGVEPTGANRITLLASEGAEMDTAGGIRLGVDFIVADAQPGELDQAEGSGLQSVATSEADMQAGVSVDDPSALGQVGYFRIDPDWTANEYFAGFLFPASYVVAGGALELFIGDASAEFIAEGDTLRVYAFAYGTLTAADWRTPTQIASLDLLGELAVADMLFGVYNVLPCPGLDASHCAGGVLRVLIVSGDFADAVTIDDGESHIVGYEDFNGDGQPLRLHLYLEADAAAVVGAQATAVGAANTGVIAAIPGATITGAQAAAVATANPANFIGDPFHVLANLKAGVARAARVLRRGVGRSPRPGQG